MSEIQNAVIKSTMLGTEDHGIFTAYITLDYGGAGQAFGGYAFDEPPSTDGDGERRGHAFGAEYIMRVLKVLEVQCWEKLPGTSCRVRASHVGVEAIGHYLKDNWFTPTVVAEAMEASHD